jgi:hypothetical protein
MEDVPLAMTRAHYFGRTHLLKRGLTGAIASWLSCPRRNRISTASTQSEKKMNRLSSFQRLKELGAIAGVVWVMAGCASAIPPPTAQMAVSKMAIANAVSAGGNEYASLEMTRALEKMDRASRAMDHEDYENARRLAEEAQADARLAEKLAHSAKAQKAASAIQEDSRVLREEINRKSK